MDSIDKALLLLPVLPVADLMSTLFSLRLGGEEIGLLARPMLQNYGSWGLIVVSVSASLMFLVFMGILIRVKKLVVKQFTFKWMLCVLAMLIYWIFFLEGFYVSTVVSNLVVPWAFPLLSMLILRVFTVGICFIVIGIMTMQQMRRLSFI